MSTHERIYISVDIETAGPNPTDYPLLAIGACLVDRPEVSFYIELIPDREGIEEEALAVSNLDLETLRQNGTDAQEALQAFASWIEQQTSGNKQAVFVAFNAPFDWMFIADYFHRYLGHNPFGYQALDIKALYMGKHAVDWDQTTMAEVTKVLGIPIKLSHHALKDAQDQARIFNALVNLQANQHNEVKP
jgi:DNA polymerase III alpha subunit (gram-positive type)